MRQNVEGEELGALIALCPPYVWLLHLMDHL